MKTASAAQVVTVTLNPAIDRTITIPSFCAGKVNRVMAEHSRPGGKGVNVAIALADAGYSAGVTGFLGAENCSSFENLFSSRGIADYFIRIPGQTRTGIKISDPAQHQTTDINFPGLSPSTVDVDRLVQQLDELASSAAKIFVIAGSVPPGVPATIYGAIISRLKGCGKQVVFDTSGEPFARALGAGPNVVKPNIHELEAFVGTPLESDASIIAAARQLLSRGIELVVVSMGERGALFVNNREASLAVPPVVEVKSTVGAGDAMVAGIVAAMLHGLSLDAMAACATGFSLRWLTDGREIVEDWGARVKVVRAERR
jgi:1-phosphofructokinase